MGFKRSRVRIAALRPLNRYEEAFQWYRRAFIFAPTLSVTLLHWIASPSPWVYNAMELTLLGIGTAMKVFISHASADEALAHEVSDTLRRAGLEVWDGSDILPGENWAAKVAVALQESEAMVVLLTPDALRSSNVRYEIAYALGDKGYSNRLIPVLAASPEQLPKDEIPWILNTFQTVSLPRSENGDKGLERIAHLLTAAA